MKYSAQNVSTCLACSFSFKRTGQTLLTCETELYLKLQFGCNMNGVKLLSGKSIVTSNCNDRL